MSRPVALWRAFTVHLATLGETSCLSRLVAPDTGSIRRRGFSNESTGYWKFRGAGFRKDFWEECLREKGASVLVTRSLGQTVTRPTAPQGEVPDAENLECRTCRNFEGRRAWTRLSPEPRIEVHQPGSGCQEWPAFGRRDRNAGEDLQLLCDQSRHSCRERESDSRSPRRKHDRYRVGPVLYPAADGNHRRVG